MSRHDPRKALPVRLPQPLRQALIAMTPEWRPLPHLLRRALQQGLKSGQVGTRPRPGSARPVLLQLSAKDRAALRSFAQAHDLTEEEAVLALATAGT